MAFYSYEYFSGANVVVELQDMPLHEAVGISFGINETKIPLYGYSSRHFDAVGRGKVLVRGTLAINYVHKDYLMASLQASKQLKGEPIENPIRVIRNDNFDKFSIEDYLKSEDSRQTLVAEINKDPSLYAEYIKALQDYYWAEGERTTTGQDFIDVLNYNAHDLAEHVGIKITFGERNEFNNFNGVTGLYLSGLHFIGSGIPIQIDENVIVEEYQFFARNIHGLVTKNKISNQATTPGVDPSFEPFSELEQVVS